MNNKLIVIFLFFLVLPFSLGVKYLDYYESFPNTMYYHEDNLSVCNYTYYDHVTDTYEGDMGTYYVCKGNNWQNNELLDIVDWYGESDYQARGHNMANYIYMILPMQDFMFSNASTMVSVRSNGSGGIGGGSLGGLNFGLMDSKGRNNNSVFGISNIGLGNMFVDFFDQIGTMEGQLGLGELVQNNTISVSSANAQDISNLDRINGYYADHLVLNFVTDTENVFYDWINVSFLDASNELPTFNLTPETYKKCINLSQPYPYVMDVQIDVHDEEGDTIYYGYSQGYRNLSQSYDFAGVDWANDITFDSNDLTDFYSYCGMDESNLDLIDYHPYEHNVVLKRDIFNYNDVMLELNGDCHKTNNSINKNLGSSVPAGSFQLDFYDFENNDEVNLTLYDYDVTEWKFKLLIEKYGHNFNMSLYHPNGSLDNVFNFSSDLDSFRIRFTNGVDNPDVWYIEVDYSGNGISWDERIESTKEIESLVNDFSVLQLTPGYSDKILLAYYYQTLIQYNLVWSENKPNNITFYKPGSSQHRFYVTDNVHLNSDWTEQTIWIKLEQKEYCWGDATGGLVDIIDTHIASVFENALRQLGLYDEAENLMMLLYLILLVMFCIGSFKLLGHVNIITNNLLASASCFLVAFLFRMNNYMVAFLFLGSISLAVILARGFDRDG